MERILRPSRLMLVLRAAWRPTTPLISPLTTNVCPLSVSSTVTRRGRWMRESNQPEFDTYTTPPPNHVTHRVKLAEARLEAICLNSHGPVASTDHAELVRRRRSLPELDALFSAFELREEAELLEA